MNNTYDIAIVGAGASGLAAAITAARAGASVLVLERMPRAGKKILVTGNGRCNLSNLHAATHEYHNKHFAVPALQAFGTAECKAFFDSLGLALQADAESRIYPRSNTASSVLDALRFGAQRAGVEFRCDSPVTQVQVKPGSFVLSESVHAKRVIIAAGGCAAPAQGSDGSGFALLRSLGHRIVEPKPALVQIRCDSPLLGMLKGQRVRAALTLEYDEKILCSSEGEVLFTDDGLSGIAAMELSRDARAGCVVALDLLPEYSHAELAALLSAWCAACPDYTPAQLLGGLLPKRVAEAVVKSGGEAKRFAFPVVGTRGFAHAQVTAGGADMREFNPQDLQSRLVPGLYACGEVLDVDGGCGGFNLHWAWASGILSASSIVCYEGKLA